MSEVKRYVFEYTNDIGDVYEAEAVENKDGEYVSASDYDLLRTENERLLNRAINLEAEVEHLRNSNKRYVCLAVAVREEDARACESVMHFDPTKYEAEACARDIRALPLPDKKAEKIRKVLDAAIEDKYNHTSPDGGTCYCDLCEAVRDLETE